MAVIDYEKKEVNAKIVYYGPGLSGKTSNIHYIYSKLLPEHRGELMTLSTKSHRTLFFDFLPVELGEVKGLNTRFFLYTVPGQIFYNNIRKQILKDVDGIVFVADSRVRMKNENIQSLQNLEENLAEMGRNIRDIPFVIQFNKRDMPDIQSIADLQAQINKYNVPTFEATALTGQGVLKTLTTISKMILKKLRESSSLQAKLIREGPAEAYGLSDDFIAMTLEEAQRVKEQMGITDDAHIRIPAPPSAAEPLPPSSPSPPPSPPPPVTSLPKTTSPSAPPAPPATTAAATPPPPPATPPPPPPQSSEVPAPPSPSLSVAAVTVPPASPPPNPVPAPPLSSAAAPVNPPASPPPAKLVIARWGNPQVTSSGIIKLPIVFKDPNTGQEYTSLLALQMNPLTPAK